MGFPCIIWTTHGTNCLEFAIMYSDLLQNWLYPGHAPLVFPTIILKTASHDDVIEWKHYPRYWPSVRGIHRSPVNSLHRGQWGGALVFSLICVWINGWVNNRQAGDLRRYRAHRDVTVMSNFTRWPPSWRIRFWSRFVHVLHYGINLSFSETRQILGLLSSCENIKEYSKPWHGDFSSPLTGRSSI